MWLWFQIRGWWGRCYTVGCLPRSITCKYSPDLSKCRRHKQRHLSQAQLSQVTPCPSRWKGPGPPPPPCKRYIFFSFRRGGGKLVVCEHGVERADLPGYPLPEGAHLLLVGLLLLALPSPVTTSSDVFEISGKVMTLVGTQIIGQPHKSPVCLFSKMGSRPSPSDQDGTTIIQTFLESRSS